MAPSKTAGLKDDFATPGAQIAFGLYVAVAKHAVGGVHTVVRGPSNPVVVKDMVAQKRPNIG